MINKSGLKLLRPFILQLSKALSALIVFEVDKIASCLNLSKCDVLIERLFVIFLSFLFIVKKSLETAILADINGILYFLLMK